MATYENRQKYLLIMRLLAEGGFTYRELGDEYGVSHTTICELKAAIETHSLTQDMLREMPADDVARYLKSPKERELNQDYLHPDLEAISRKVSSSRHYTRQLAWETYAAEAKRLGLMFYSYQGFCKKLKSYISANNITMHIEHKPGQKVFIDWVGDAMYVFDAFEDKRRKTTIIIFVLPYSGYFYARGYFSIDKKCWLDSHIRAMEYFGGTPRLWVPDNCGTATERKKKKFDPIKLIKDYQFLADKYDASIFPTRVRSPQDKATVERCVQAIETRFCARYADDIFYTLDEFNEILEQTVKELNNHVREDGTTSAEVFTEYELPKLLPLPEEDVAPYVSKEVKVQRNYHIQLNKKYNSVPYSYVGKKLQVHYTDSSLAIYEGSTLICTHPITTQKYTTAVEHMPPNHLKARGLWSKEGMLEHAKEIGPACFMAINHIFKLTDIEEKAYLDVKNIFGLKHKYSAVELENVCSEAVEEGVKLTYQSAVERLKARAKKQQEIEEKGLLRFVPDGYAEPSVEVEGLVNDPDSYAM